MHPDFRGRRVVITGAAGIYGTELAEGFARAGASLCLSDLRQAPLDALAAGLALPADRLLTHATDLTHDDSVRDLVTLVTTRWRAPDVVVNNAGIYPFAGVLDTDASLWDRVMSTNLRAPFLLMQGFARAMIDAGVRGCFVNVSSAAADILRTNGVPYCVSKRALEWLSQGFALDLGRHGVRVNCVRPGFAPGSDLVAFPPGYAEAMSQASALGRPRVQGDLASAVLFLASDAAGSVTGACIATDCGSSIARRTGPASEPRR